MELIWYCIVALSLTVYVVLDGFDLGAGIIHLFAARNEHERRTLLNAIGPFWDGNEVWLLSTGALLYLAFPIVYASALSGFYLPLIIILWLLMLRGLGIELRHHVESPLARQACDGAFAVSSGLLAFFFGVALGNLIRGVPLQEDGYFFLPLWTDLKVSAEPGVIDWFTAAMGLTAFLVLSFHGSAFIALKTLGELHTRARSTALAVWWGVVAAIVFTVVAAGSIRPGVWDRFSTHPWGWIFPVLALSGLTLARHYLKRDRQAPAFYSSSAFIIGSLTATAFALFPDLLTATTGAARSLTPYNSAGSPYGLSVGLIWWIPGIFIVSGYFLFLYRSFRGKAKVGPSGY